MYLLKDLKQIIYVCNNFNDILDLAITDLNCCLDQDEMPLVTEDAYHPPLCVSIELNKVRFQLRILISAISTRRTLLTYTKVF